MVKIMKFNIDDTYKIDSNLGGSFSLKFLKYEYGRYYFNITNPGYEKVVTFDIDTVQNVKLARRAKIDPLTQTSIRLKSKLVCGAAVNEAVRILNLPGIEYKRRPEVPSIGIVYHLFFDNILIGRVYREGSIVYLGITNSYVKISKKLKTQIKL